MSICRCSHPQLSVLSLFLVRWSLLPFLSVDVSFEAELARRRPTGGTVEFESSVDLDGSYPPASAYRRPDLARSTSLRSSGASGMYSNASSMYGGERRHAMRSSIDTPSPEPSDVDMSLSGSMDVPPRYPSSALTRNPSLGRQPSTVSSSASYSRQPSSVARSRYTDDSAEDLNPELDDSYEPAPYKPVAVSQAYLNATKAIASRPPVHPTTQQRQQQPSKSSRHLEYDDSMEQPQQRSQPRHHQQQQQQQQDDEDEEVSISFDESDDLQASNNTLIRKAQQLQERDQQAERARAEKEQRELDQRRRQEEEAAVAADKRKRDLEAEKKRAYEERMRREQEEDDERARRELEEATRLRQSAEVDDEYEDEFATPRSRTETDDESGAHPSNATTTAKTGLDALDSMLDAEDDDEAIERARREVEAQEEAELQAARERQSQMGATGSLDDMNGTRRDMKLLDTAAFTNNKPWRVDDSDEGSFGESGDLALARRRLEEEEAAEIAAEERRRAELEERRQKLARSEQEEADRTHARKASLEQAVEESYEEEEFESAPSQRRPSPAPAPAPVATTVDSKHIASSKSHPSNLSHAPPSSSPPSSSSDLNGPPSVFAAALASLDPQVSSLVMKAIADQMVASSSAGPPAPKPASYPLTSASSAPIFNPSQTRDAAEDAWEKLLTLRAGAHPSPPPPPAPAPLVNGLRQPPLNGPTSQAATWEAMLSAVAASHLARTQATATAATNQADRLFTKRPQSFGGSTLPGSYTSIPPSSYPTSSTHFDTRDLLAQGGMQRYVDRVLHSGLAEDRARTSLRVETEREALRRLLTFQPYSTSSVSSNEHHSDGVSSQLAQRVDEQKQLYMRDQAILNSVLRRVLATNEAKERNDHATQQNRLDLTGVKEEKEKNVSEGVKDDGRELPADDVIRMVRHRQ